MRTTYIDGKAVAEIDELRAINDMLVTALRTILEEVAGGNPTRSPLQRVDFIRTTCRTAIADAEESL